MVINFRKNFLIFIHRLPFLQFDDRPERWDEWIAFDSPRISPFRSRTAHSSLHSFLSPAPNILVPSAPCTGSNDVRVYLPEFSRLLNMLQPAMEELACLAEDVSAFACTLVDTITIIFRFQSLKEKPAVDYDAVTDQIQHPPV